MYCKNCDRIIPEDSIRCYNCGAVTETDDLQSIDNKLEDIPNKIIEEGTAIEKNEEAKKVKLNKKEIGIGIVFILLSIIIIGKLTFFKNDTKDSSVVVIQDKNLEKVVRDKINKPTGEIYKNDVDKVTWLDARCYSGERQIKVISGLEKFNNLNTLILVGNQISNIEPLKGLTNLTRLDASDNIINNIEALKGLTNMTMLDLSNNQISNIEPLKGLTNLTGLMLSVNKITNIDALKGLTKLNNLYLSDNRITDYSPVTSNSSINLETDFYNTILN